MKKLVSLLLALTLCVVIVGCTTADDTKTAVVADIAKYGNLILSISGEELFNQGYEHGDLLEVTVAEQTWEVPLCSNYRCG